MNELTKNKKKRQTKYQNWQVEVERLGKKKVNYNINMEILDLYQRVSLNIGKFKFTGLNHTDFGKKKYGTFYTP